jgi:hypothetical protein
MTSQINQNKVNKAFNMLAMIRQKQQERINLGRDYINLYFEDVEGDWLENWGNDEVSKPCLLKQFFNQNCQSVKKIKHLLGNKLDQFINDCEVYLNLADQDEQLEQILLGLRNCLGLNNAVLLVRGNNNNNYNFDEVELLELVEKLLEDFEVFSKDEN